MVLWRGESLLGAVHDATLAFQSSTANATVVSAASENETGRRFSDKSDRASASLALDSGCSETLGAAHADSSSAMLLRITRLRWYRSFAPIPGDAGSRAKIFSHSPARRAACWSDASILRAPRNASSARR